MKIIENLNENSKEIWRDVVGYEGLYQVSNLGRVKSLGRFVVNPVTSKGYMWKPEKILRPCKHSKGYLLVGLHKDGYLKTAVHRLVALAFIPNPQNLPQIDHINADKTNNNVNNLRWVTAKQNVNNPLNMVHLIGENNPFYGKKHSEETKRKISDRLSGKNNPKAHKVKNIDTNEIFNTVKEASIKYNVSFSAIVHAIKRKGKCSGCKWEYA